MYCPVRASINVCKNSFLNFFVYIAMDVVWLGSSGSGCIQLFSLDIAMTAIAVRDLRFRGSSCSTDGNSPKLH